MGDTWRGKRRDETRPDETISLMIFERKIKTREREGGRGQ